MVTNETVGHVLFIREEGPTLQYFYVIESLANEFVKDVQLNRRPTIRGASLASLVLDVSGDVYDVVKSRYPFESIISGRTQMNVTRTVKLVKTDEIPGVVYY